MKQGDEEKQVCLFHIIIIVGILFIYYTIVSREAVDLLYFNLNVSIN